VAEAIGIKWCGLLVFSGPIIFEATTLLVSHLNYDVEKCVTSAGCAEVLTAFVEVAIGFL
jgi:hypothetical protein